jgi:hypothetical protein
MSSFVPKTLVKASRTAGSVRVSQTCERTVEEFSEYEMKAKGEKAQKVEARGRKRKEREREKQNGEKVVKGDRKTHPGLVSDTISMVHA